MIASGTYKSAVVKAFGAPLTVEESRFPVLGEHDVLLKVQACGLCRTDLKIWQGHHPAATKAPLVMGHEIAAQICEIGPGVDDNLLGRRVVVYTYLYCGKCRFCRVGRENMCLNITDQIGYNLPGGYAQYVRAPLRCLIPIPDGVSFRDAAVAADAVATSYHALVTKAKVQPGETVLLTGVGGLGLNAVQIAKHLGARVAALDINDKALEAAKKLGADDCVNSSGAGLFGSLQALNGIDVIVDFTGNAILQSGLVPLLQNGGRFCTVGYSPGADFGLSTTYINSHEIEIYGVRWCTRRELGESLELVARGIVKPQISQAFALHEINEALAFLTNNHSFGRIILEP